MAAFTVSSSASNFTGAAFHVYASPTYNTVTDELIEAPVIEQDKAARS